MWSGYVTWRTTVSNVVRRNTEMIRLAAIEGAAGTNVAERGCRHCREPLQRRVLALFMGEEAGGLES